MEHPDFMAEGAHGLLRSPQERTARRTEHLLVAARLSFVFSHGALAVAAALTREADVSWWLVFLPAWLGDMLCGALCVLSWFASCPYVKMCLAARQARFGDANPSILTDILPDIVWSILGLLFLSLAVIGELLFCHYLDLRWRGEQHELWPSATVFLFLSFLAFSQGVLVRSSGELFFFSGLAGLLTGAGALLGCATWALPLPSTFSVACLIGSTGRRRQSARRVLSQEELRLRLAEQAVLLAVAAALAGLALALAGHDSAAGAGPRPHAWTAAAATFGASAGAGVCGAASLRARLAMVESRRGAVEDRLLSLLAQETLPPLAAAFGGGSLREPSLFHEPQGCSSASGSDESNTPSAPMSQTQGNASRQAGEAAVALPPL